jgi:uncharacterized protein
MKMNYRFLTLAFLLNAALSFPAFALDLHQARSSGMVGEKLDGYAAALSATPEVQALVTDVNAKRRQEYERISKQNGQPIDTVAKLAAQEIFAKLTPGSSYQGTDGNWKKR